VSGAQAQTVTLLDYTDVSTAVPSGSATVLGEDGGTVKRFAIGPMASFVSLKDPRFGLAYDGTTDDTAALNAAFATAAAAGYKLIGDAGQILVNSGTLKLPSGLYIEWEPGAEILHQYPITGTRGFIEQTNLNVKISDVYWKGCKITGVDATTSKGNVFCLYGDDLRFVDVVIDGFGGPGRAYLISGDRMRVIGGQVLNPFGGGGTGGVRVSGGDGFYGEGIYCNSGDDCFQFVTGDNAVTTTGLGDQDITNGTFVNCYGISDTARVVIAAVTDPNVSMSADLINCTFVNCRGEARGASSAVMLGAHTSYSNGHTGVIRDLSVIGGEYTQTDSTATLPAANLYGSATDAGVVSNLSLVNVTLRTAADVETVMIRGLQTEPRVEGCTIYASTHATASAPTVNLYQGDDALIQGNRIWQGGDHAIRTPNATGRRALRATIRDNTIYDCKGVVMFDNVATGSTYVGNVLHKLSGGASATGLSVSSFSIDCYANNTFIGIERNYLDSGTGSQLLGGDSTGTFTPEMTFATPGDLSVFHTKQEGWYTTAGALVFGVINIDFTPTFTTASGNMRITGLPFTAKNVSTYVGGGAVSSGTANLSYAAGYTALASGVVQNQTYLHVIASGTGKQSAALTSVQVTTGVAQSLTIFFSYLRA
jgi:hypothetical protein